VCPARVRLIASSDLARYGCAMQLVNGRFLTQRITGAQRYGHEVVRRLVSTCGAGRLQVLTPRHQGAIPEELAASTSQFGRLRGHPWEQLELGRRANTEGGVLWSPVNVGPINARCQVVTIHDLFSIEFPRWVGRRFHLWYSFVLPRLAASARHIITVSEYSKSRIVEILKVPESKVSVVYPGVDAHFAIAEHARLTDVRDKYNLPEGFILTLGSLEPRKNLHRVVDAWLLLDNDGRPPLVIAGGLGTQKVFGTYDVDELRRHKEVRLLSYVPDEDLAALYSAAGLFVYASLLEGFGLPPLEAMACGANVVLSDTSAMRETNGGMAFMVDPDDVESIADGITRALRKGATRAGKGRQSMVVKRNFDWASTARQVGAILKLYE